LRKSSEFDDLINRDDAEWSYADRQAVFLGADWWGNLEAAADDNSDDNLNYFTVLVDGYYLSIFFA